MLLVYDASFLSLPAILFSLHFTLPLLLPDVLGGLEAIP